MLEQLFKGLFDTELTAVISVADFLLCLGFSLLLGLLLALAYMYRTRYTKSFVVTLALLPAVVCVVIMMVNGSIGTGLAVAGTFALVRFRSVPGTAREIAAIFTAVAIGLAMGMGMLGVAVVFFLLAAAAVLALTKLHFGAMPENAKVLRITVPEDVDYESALPDVFRAHHVTATLEKVRTESMGTLFELTYQVNLPSAVPSKALLDDLRERNGSLPILFTNLGDKDSL